MAVKLLVPECEHCPCVHRARDLARFVTAEIEHVASREAGHAVTLPALDLSGLHPIEDAE
jgi:hypothetical protein